MDYMMNGKVIETSEQNTNSDARIKAYGAALKEVKAPVDFVIGNMVIETVSNDSADARIKAYDQAIKDKKD